MDLVQTILVISAACFLVCGPMLIMAAFGSRAGHPVCSRCDYNLTGLRDGTRACPECGGELRIHASAIRHVDVVRTCPLVAGLLMTVASIVCAIGAAWIELLNAAGC